MNGNGTVALAWSLRQEHPAPGSTPSTDIGSDWYAARKYQWDIMTLAVADACASSNPRFDRRLFVMAAGYIRRPDGSMYPTVDPS